MELLALLLTLGATFCWGSAQVIGKVALRRINTLVFNTVRFSAAASVIVVGGILAGATEGIELNAPFLAAVASGVLGWFVATTVFFFVLKRGSAHRVIPVGNAHPFWAILFGVLFLGEGISWVIPISAALVFLGTFLLGRRRSGDSSGWRYGVPFASLVAILWGANAFFNKFALNGGMTLSSILLVRIVSAVMLFWIAFVLRNLREKQEFHGRSLGLSAVSGLMAFPVGSFLYVSALSMEEASTLAPVTGSTILFGFVLSVAFLHERPTKRAVLGVLAIFGGIILMMFCGQTAFSLF